MNDVTYDEDRVKGPESIERTLNLSGEVIATAYIDPTRPDGTLAWPLASGLHLTDVLHAFTSDFFRDRAAPLAGTTFDYWIGDSYFAQELGEQLSLDSAVRTMTDSAHQAGQVPQLADLSDGSITLELIFDAKKPNPVRAALALSEIDLTALANFFTRFHINARVRDDRKIADFAFCENVSHSSTRQGLGFLRPLSVLEKKDDDLYRQSGWD